MKTMYFVIGLMAAMTIMETSMFFIDSIAYCYTAMYSVVCMGVLGFLAFMIHGREMVVNTDLGYDPD